MVPILGACHACYSIDDISMLNDVASENQATAIPLYTDIKPGPKFPIGFLT